MGRVPFSDEHDRITTEIELWRAIMKKKTNCTYSMGKLRRLIKKSQIDNPLLLSLTEAKTKLKNVTREYWNFKRTAKDSRETFLEGKAAAIAKEKDQEKYNILKQLMHRERQRESSRRIKYTLGKLRGGGITRIEVNTANGIREVTTKTGIERE